MSCKDGAPNSCAPPAGTGVVSAFAGDLGAGREDQDLVSQDDAEHLRPEDDGRELLVEGAVSERLLQDRGQVSWPPGDEPQGHEAEGADV